MTIPRLLDQAAILPALRIPRDARAEGNSFSF